VRIDRDRPGVLRVTLHVYELSALVAAARWAVTGAEGEISSEGRDQLRQVLASYDGERKRLEHDSPQAAPQEMARSGE
jgi:hypothetical protein